MVENQKNEDVADAQRLIFFYLQSRNSNASDINFS